MFWDGTQWLVEQPAPRPRRTSNTIRALAITSVGAVLVAVAALAPGWVADAAGPSLSVNGPATPGRVLSVTGSHFPRGQYVQLAWDGSWAGMPLIHVSDGRHFDATFTVPDTARPGRHRLSAGTSSSSATYSDRSVITSVPVIVLAPTAAPTLASSAAPGASGAPPASKAPGAGSGSTARPTTAPTSGATTAPTSGATTAPTSGVTSAPPTARPTPTPTKASTPAPTAAATPTPAPPAGLAVPASIDSTGATDASAALNSWLATVPDGSTIVFKAGGVYRLNHGIKFMNRHNLTFNGNGATLKAAGSGSAPADSPFALWTGNDHITIENFTILGNNPSPGKLTVEGQSGVLLYGNSNVTLTHLTIKNPYADCVYSGISSSHVGVNGLTWTNSTCVGAGRNGFSITGGGNATVSGVSFTGLGYHVLDVEPDFAQDSVSYVTFKNNSVGTYSLTGQLIGFFFAANGAASNVSHITVSGNTVSGEAHRGYDSKAAGLNTYVMTANRSSIVFTNNKSTQTVAGPVLDFQGVNGLTVTGNSQPLSSGSLAYITNCTNVTGP